MAPRAVVIGGTGQLGRVIAKRFLLDGYRVTLCSRGRRALPAELSAGGAEALTVDRDQPGALAAALRGGADAVIDTVAYDRAHAEQLLEIQDDVGAFAVISSCSVYKDGRGRTLDESQASGFPEFGGAVTEACATVDPGPGNYSTRKIALERHLLDNARRPVAIIRPGAVYGPHTRHPREWWFVKRMLDGRGFIPLAYRGESRLHTVAAANVAACVAAALSARRSCILNAGDPEAPSVAEIGAAIAGHMRYTGTLLPLAIGGGRDHTPVGWTPWSLPKPIVLSTAAASALGYAPVTSYERAIGECCDWLKAQDAANWRTVFPDLAGYPLALFDYAAEDEFLRKFRE